ncbi:MAG: response regulator receiver protein [Bacteroidetes bacterium]|nr:response regulator receiver protein [Bacteroidota bacterium]
MTQNKICFLIDDDEDDQSVFQLALEDTDEPVDCVFASSGTEAINKLKDETFNPCCIFLDLNMPGMNGKQCLIELRKMDHLTDTPVFIYSTSSDDKVISEIKQLGATDYIIKPTSISVLTKILSEHIRC